MIKNFKEEIDLISKNDKITDKTLIIEAYTNFYNSTLGFLPADNPNTIEYYEAVLKNTFKMVVSLISLQEKASYDAKQFMTIYFKILESSIPFAKDIIMIFEREMNSLTAANEYANVIDKFASIPLDIKLSIMAHFREYINSMSLMTINLCGEEDSQELRHDILEMLSVKLEEYLKDGLNKGIDFANLIDNLKAKLTVYTKDYLMNKLKNGEFGIKDFQDETVKNFLVSCNENEQKIWLMGMVYAIAGYDKNDKSQEEEKVREICKLLGISKLRYIVTTISMAIHVLKAMKSEEFDVNPPKRSKY